MLPSRQILPFRMPIGITDFTRLRTEEYPGAPPYWFADKTGLIEAIIRGSNPVVLITRPRRFGKTLNMSMLQHFFDMGREDKDVEKNKKLFDGLTIAHSKFMETHQGQYPVVFFTLKNIDKENFEITLAAFRKRMWDVYKEHRYLLDEKTEPGGKGLDREERAFFQKILERKVDQEELADSLKDLITFLARYYGRKVIVLIDEYDSPLLSAFHNGFLDKFLKFYRNFLGSALKDNEAILYKAVLTGIVKISGAGLFSGLNNHGSYGILDERFSDYFGFTQENVITLLKQINGESYRNEIDRWYNGYRFGYCTIYNPWSVLCCIDQKFNFQAHWAYTSDDRLLKKCLLESEDAAKAYFAQLMAISKVLDDENKTDEVKSKAESKTLENENKILKIKLKSSLQLSDPMYRDISSLVTLLLSSGYLTAEIEDRDRHLSTLSVRIPSVEVRGIYADVFNEWIHRKIGKPNSALIECLRQGNIAAFCEGVKAFFLQVVSYHDVGKGKREAFYHGFFLGLLGLMMETHEGYLYSNRESGLGRYDVMFEPNDREHDIGVIIELKRTSNPVRLKSETEKGINQIYNSCYLTELRHKKVQQVAIISFAFCGKQVEYQFEKPNAIEVLLSKSSKKILPRPPRNSRQRGNPFAEGQADTRPTKWRKVADTHWYTDDEINILLSHYLGQYPNVELIAGINLDLHHGSTLSHNLDQREREIKRIEQVTGSRTIVLPINLGKRHWVALYIHHASVKDRMQPAIGYFDPLGCDMPRTLHRQLSRLYPNVAFRDYLISPITLQRDGYNCGPWVIEILLSLIESGKLPPVGFDITAARAKHQTILQLQEQKY